MVLRRLAYITATGVALLLYGFSFVPALAATGLSIQPVKIDQTLNPGDVLDGSILLSNASDGPVNVELSLQDFVPTAGADGIQFIGRTEGVTSVIDWIHVETKPTFSLDVGEQISIPYTITAPQNAEPGSHLGVILFKAAPKNAVAGSLKVGTQVGTLVMIAIPGNHLEKGNILDFTVPLFSQKGPIPFDIKFQNTGTVHFEPKGSIVIRNMFGQKAGEVPITGQVALPTSVKELKFAWNPGAFALGRYTASATIYDGEGDALTSREVSFYVVPVWYIIGFLVVITLIYLLLRYLKRHVRLTLQ
ncbi:MAG TPA: hypothetical protein VG984_01825 [Candidatus Paceibacterota bacterium]|nr:hypothetical protein [Candidatus Paceibacterota bacterium]